MASAHPAESEAVFAARVAASNLTDIMDKFTANGWLTFADFAMAASDFNGKDPELFKKDVLTPLVGEAIERVPKIRRLYVQAYAAHAQLLEKWTLQPPSVRCRCTHWTGRPNHRS